MRRLRGLIAALLLAVVLGVAAAIVYDPCKGLTPDDWFWWWWYGCGKDSSGGGGSGAGMD